MTTVEDLIAVHDISQLKYRYLRALDTQDWDLMEQCFTEDASTWYSGGTFSHRGRKVIVDFLRQLVPPSFVSSHIVMHPEITFHGPDKAEGIWRLQDVVYFTEANPVFEHGKIEGGEEMTGAGHYYDEYVREADGWKISSTGYVRIYEVIERKAARANIDLDCDPDRGMRR